MPGSHRHAWAGAARAIAGLLCALLLSACAGKRALVDPTPVECPPPPPCPACETPVCPVVEPRIIEKEKIVTRTIEVPAPRPEDAMEVFGEVEKVFIEVANITLDARIDTGAATCSIHAENVTKFERDGRNYIRFTIPDEGQGAPTTLELRLKRRVLIKQKGKEPVRRYVVRMWLQIGDVRERVDISLADRDDFDFPVLIGRNFLTDNALVDVSGRHLLH